MAVNLRALGWGLAASVAALDQVSKWWVFEHLLRDTRVIEVTSFFNLVTAWNTGISFGMFGAGGEVGKWLLIVVAILIVGYLSRWLRQAESRWTAIAIGLVIGGAFGNVIDRMRLGAVADFLDVHVAGYHWPAFNVADSAIVVGAAVLLLEALFSPSETPKTKSTTSKDEE